MANGDILVRRRLEAKLARLLKERAWVEAEIAEMRRLLRRHAVRCETWEPGYWFVRNGRIIWV